MTRWGEASDPEHIEVRRPEVKCACEFRQIGGVHKPAERKSAYDGDYIEYEVELDDGQNLIVNEYTKDCSTVHADGEKVHLSFDPERISLYASDTEEVLSL